MNKNKFVEFWLPVYLYAAIIFMLSSMPQIPIPFAFKFSDKIEHIIEYAIFGYLLIRAFRNSSFKLTLAQMRFLIILIGFIYGITDEIHQYFVPGRATSTLDIFADGAGVVLGQFFSR